MFCTRCKEPFDWTKTNWSGTSDNVYLDNTEGVEKTVLEALVVCMRTERRGVHQITLQLHLRAGYLCLKSSDDSYIFNVPCFNVRDYFQPISSLYAGKTVPFFTTSSRHEQERCWVQ